jgi:hypothetical protein
MTRSSESQFGEQVSAPACGKEAGREGEALPPKSYLPTRTHSVTESLTCHPPPVFNPQPCCPPPTPTGGAARPPSAPRGRRDRKRRGGGRSKHNLRRAKHRVRSKRGLRQFTFTAQRRVARHNHPRLCHNPRVGQFTFMAIASFTFTALGAFTLTAIVLAKVAVPIFGRGAASIFGSGPVPIFGSGAASIFGSGPMPIFGSGAVSIFGSGRCVAGAGGHARASGPDDGKAAGGRTGERGIISVAGRGGRGDGVERVRGRGTGVGVRGA